MKKASVAKAIKQYSGNIAAIARAFNVSRQTIYTYIEDKPDLKQLITDERESMIDNVESTLYSQARNGNTTAMIFFLKTQGKSRGYVERQETDLKFSRMSDDELVKFIEGRVGNIGDSDV